MTEIQADPHKETNTPGSKKRDGAIIAAVITAIATIAAAICTPLISSWIKNDTPDSVEDSSAGAKAAAGTDQPAASGPEALAHGNTAADNGAGGDKPGSTHGATGNTPLAPAGEQILADAEPVTAGRELRFPFKGQANTPLLFRISGEGERLRLLAAVLDEVEKPLASSRTIGLGANKEGMVFTPATDGQFTLQLKAHSGSGRVQVGMQEISPPPAQRGMQRPLPMDSPRTGRLAEGAYDTFTFRAEAKEAMTFLFKSDPVYKCNAEIIPPDGKPQRLALFQNRTPPMTASFIAPVAGTYTLKLTATRLYGNYEIVRKPMQ